MSKKFVEISLIEHEYTLSDHKQYTPDQIKKICDDLIAIAEGAGLSDCYLQFTSNMEPYEDYLDSPSIIPCGKRKSTSYELEEEKECKEQEALAVKLGLTFYEAGIVKKLEANGITVTIPK